MPPAAETSTCVHRSRFEIFLENIPHAGIILIIVSCMGYVIEVVTMKKVNIIYSMNPMQSVSTSLFLLCIYQFFVVLFIGNANYKAAKGEGFWLLARGFWGAVGTMTTFAAYNLLPTGDAAAITCSAPVYVCILAFLVLREKIKCIYVILLVVNLIGVLFVSKPDFLFSSITNDIKITTGPLTSHQRENESTSLLGVILANMAAISSANAIICLRKLKNTSTNVSVFWFAFSAFITGYIGTAIMGQLMFPPLSSFIWFLASFLSVLIAHPLQTIAFRIENPCLVSIGRTSLMFFAYICQMVFFNEPIDSIRFTGGLIIVATVIGVALDKWRDSISVNISNSDQDSGEPSKKCATDKESNVA